MEESEQIEIVKNAFENLSKEHKTITLDQIKEVSGIENPENEIDILWKRGIIIKLSPDEFCWV